MSKKIYVKYYNKLLKYKFGRKMKKKTMSYLNLIFYKLIYPLAYKKAARKPMNLNKMVLIEVRRSYISNCFELLYNRLNDLLEIETHCFFIDATKVGYVEKLKRQYKIIKEIADAKCIFVNDSSEVMGAFNPREGQKIIQTWHGCGAFKKWGFSTAEKIFGANEKTMRKFPNHRNYSLVAISSEEVAWAYSEAFDISLNSGIIQPIGVSRTDIFYDEQENEKAKQLVYETIKTKNKKIVLYAPTFRGRVKNAKTPKVLDIKKMKKALGDEYVLLIKHHFLVRKFPKIPKGCEDFAFDVTRTHSIEHLLMASDLCISDYSSLIFEYSLFERPMVFLAHDINTFCDWRGFYYDYCEFAPGPIVKNTLGVIDFIKNLDERFDKQKVADFRRKFMSACDGHATDRIIAYALDKQVEQQEQGAKSRKQATLVTQ